MRTIEPVNRAYALLQVKAVDTEKRVIRGVATTPEPDRMGDVVEPLGVKFKNPLPLLWQHHTDEPVGTARFDKPTEEGITFEAKMPTIDEPGTLKDRIDEAWQSIKAGLVKGVSIGFRAIEYAFMKETDGIRFVQTEVLELSLVTIPANADATIQEIKAIALAQQGNGAASGAQHGTRAASGQQGKPAASGTTKQLHKPNGAKMPIPITEQISAFEAKRAALAGRMDALMAKAAEASTTLEAEESTEYDQAERDVARIDEHLVRLRKLDAQNKRAAQPIIVTDQASGSAARELALDGTALSPITVRRNLPKGTVMWRYCQALMLSKGNLSLAHQMAQRKEWTDTPEVELILRAAVQAGTTTDTAWAAPLVVYQQMVSEFAELLRPATIIGRIPNLRRVPFNIQVPRTTTGSTVNWVGEGAPKPVSQLAFDSITLRFCKAAGIVILTEELVRFSNPSAEAIIQQDLIAAMAQFLDLQFVDPSKAAVTNVSPASITNGVTPVTATGTTAAAARADIRTLMNTFLSNNLSTGDAVWIMTQQQANSFSMMLNALGQPAFPGMSITGGTLYGLPVVASENLPATGGSPADGYPLILAKASEIMLADDGATTIDASREAVVQLDTTPDSPPTGSTAYTSLWQQNMVGLRAERYINWLKRRAQAVQFIQNAKYAE